MTSISDVIGHYQRSIEKSAHDEARLLHCIEKLYKLPITVEHLQQTGIGKTVNSLRKYDKEVGIAAKALVAKWKAMVAAEEELVNVDDTHNVNGNDGSNSDNENCNGNQFIQESESANHSNNKYKQSSSRNEKTSDVDRKDRKHKENVSENVRSHSQHSTSDSKKTENVLSDRPHRDKTNSSSSSKHHREKHSSSDNRTSQNHQHHNDRRKDEKGKSSNIHSSRKPPTPEPVQESPPMESDDNLDENDFDDEDEEKLIIDTEHNKEKCDEIEKHSHRDSSRTSKSSSRHKSSSNKRSNSEDKLTSEHENKKKSKTDGKDRDKKDTAKSSSSKSHSDEKRDKEKSSDRHHHKSNKKDEEKNAVRNNGEAKSSSSSKSKSSDKSKETEKHGSKSDNHKSSKDKSRSSENSSNNKKSSKRKHESADDSESAEEQNSPKKSKSKRHVDDDGINNSMGNLSFEEALGMMAPPAKTVSAKLKSPKGNGVSSKISSTDASSSRSGTSTSNSNRSKTPPLLTTKIKLEPLDPKLSLDLPTISPNYKPLPLNPTVMDCVFANNTAAKPTATPRRLLTDDEALQSGISSKTIRTKIYSGMRTGAILQVPTLFNLCIRVLQKNIDALEYTGGVPFEVLKPVLDLASPEQLQLFEEYNSYLLEDTDDLWRVHCSRRYKSQKRQELESWREMYARCKEQEEERLNMLTKNISYQQKQITAPIKRTQLAYVDVDVKPPRNVLRKQEQYGTKGKIVATPAARVEALSKVTPSAAKIGDTRLRVAADVRDHAQASTNSRPKKAPLMQKTLQLMKGRFKR